MLKDYILQNGGATINANGKPVTLKSGYQLSYKILNCVPVAELTEMLITNIIKCGLKRGCYAGFWVENGKVYCDLSKRIATKKQAVTVGKETGEIAVWDWKHSCNVYCNA